MIGWALSGGGNRGSIQVGAMRALFEAGIKPDLLVGTSAGAINAAFLATDPSLECLDRLARFSGRTRRRDVFGGNLFTQLLNFVLGRDGLDSGKAKQKYLEKFIPPNMKTFGDLPLRLYVAAADLQINRLVLFGTDPAARILDAVMASSALPPVWRPYVVDGHQLVDGAFVANVPIYIAATQGADTIYALDLSFEGPFDPVHNILNVVSRAVGVLEYQQQRQDEQLAVANNKIVYRIPLGDIFKDLPADDFSHAAEMIEAGYQCAHDFLNQPTPNPIIFPPPPPPSPQPVPPGAGGPPGGGVPSGGGGAPLLIPPKGAVVFPIP